MGLGSMFRPLASRWTDPRPLRPGETALANGSPRRPGLRLPRSGLWARATDLAPLLRRIFGAPGTRCEFPAQGCRRGGAPRQLSRSSSATEGNPGFPQDPGLPTGLPGRRFSLYRSLIQSQRRDAESRASPEQPTAPLAESHSMRSLGLAPHRPRCVTRASAPEISGSPGAKASARLSRAVAPASLPAPSSASPRS